MSSTEREVIHLAIGRDACELTAHWSNLQGLAATRSHSQVNDETPCLPTITHRINNNILVARALLIDRTQVFYDHQRRLFGDGLGLDSILASDSYTSPLRWDGRIEPFHARGALEGQPQISRSYENFHNNASALAFAPQSRYLAVAHPQVSFSSSGRHVDWDAETSGSEEEEEDLFGHEKAKGIGRQQEVDWYQSTFPPLQSDLEQFWSELPGIALPPREEADAPSQAPTLEASWMEYWMPPYHPHSCLPLPSDSTIVQEWDYSFNHGLAGISDSWREDELSDRLRSILEECDACQGVVLAASSHGWSAGLSCSLLQELQDECPAVKRLVLAIDGLQEETKGDIPTAEQRNRRVRRPLEYGLMLHQYMELADVVLPIKGSSDTQFLAHVAAALESLTLSYRLSGKYDSMVGLNSSQFYGSFRPDLAFGTASHLNFREFIGQLRPSTKHITLELDMMLPPAARNMDLDSKLRQGTTIERDARVRQRRGYPSSSELPGTWMMSDKEDGGVLTCMSPLESTDGRSSHRHFALSAAFRSSGCMSTENYMTCLMEGIGPRFRPEQSSAIFLRQGIEELTSDGYGAGSYWKQVWRNASSARDDSSTSPPVLAVLGNTTRRYSHMVALTKGMRYSLSARARGTFRRDILHGLLPEQEECQEALDAVLDLRDVYTPPSAGEQAANFEDL